MSNQLPTADTSHQFLSLPKEKHTVQGGTANSSTTNNDNSKSGRNGRGFYLVLPSCCCCFLMKKKKSYRISMVKLLSVCGIVVSVLLLVALVVIFPQTFVLRSQVDNFVYKTTKDVLVIQQLITSGLHLKAYLNMSDRSIFDQDSFIVHPSDGLTKLLNNQSAHSNNNLDNHLEAHQDWIDSMLNEIFNIIPVEDFANHDYDKNVVISELMDAHSKLKILEKQIIDVNSTGTAIAIIEGEEYEGLKEMFEKKIAIIEDMSSYLSDTEDNWMGIYTIIISSVTIIAFIIVLPVMIFLFVAALNKEALNRERLKKAKAVMLLDVMNDPKLRDLFKQHCKQELSLENYEVLIRTNLYREYSRQIWEMQDILFTDTSSTSETDDHGAAKSVTSGNDTDAISSVSSGDNQTKQNSITSGSHSTTTHNSQKKTQTNPALSFNDTDNKSSLKKKKKIKNVTEEEYKIVCNKRFELANEILVDFLRLDGKNSVNVSKRFADQVEALLQEFTLFSVDSDQLVTNPDKKMNDQLPDDLFEPLQNEIAVVMLDTLQRFKLGVQFQRKMKIDKVIKEREKKAANNNGNQNGKSANNLSRK
ncbi:predicted protein [Naegleria gruberi]|uniref:Predicted protein n=1 Tax=Naegleria gruberi TaxID=5762 RepID=D2VMK7_NAEGR|nr:uncharacterized protein NAEGRDRAFT_70170 [Naegleria gruberi]EFC42082.1 predicted protein [Naegleria gruberi]|eukprot:XP_002674826.1 predicted protein [Naegleria gruberi strain NEG-M]